MDGRFSATYLIETPLDPAAVADTIAGEQSCGTFVRVRGETDDLRARARASVESIEALETVATPSLASAWLDRRGVTGPFHRARIRVSFPIANVGVNLANLATIVGGNLFDLGELTGLRLERLDLPGTYRRAYALPRHGIAGTRRIAGVDGAPLVGTIIKPNVGLSAEETGALVGRLAAAGLDFVKDDEITVNPDWAPLGARIAAISDAVDRHRDATGKTVIAAINISDAADEMLRHAQDVARAGGTCVMVNLNWCGFSAVQTLRRNTDLIIHGHRNGFGALSRHPLLGIAFQPYQVLWRLAGLDHLHVHGLRGKFAQTDDEVTESARDCLTPLAGPEDDRVMPVISSAQSAVTVPATSAAIGSPDLLFMAGGGVLAHPSGEAAGVASIREAWEATLAGIPLEAAAKERPALAEALAFFGKTA